MSAISSDVCPDCGAHLVPFNQGVSPAARLWRWFNYGRMPSGNQFRCDNCGAVLGMLTYGGGRTRSSTMPGDILTTWKRHRSMEPVPRFYAVLAGAGTVAGAGAERWLGIRWWSVPIVAVALGWLVMMCSVFWGVRDGDLWADMRATADRSHRDSLRS